MRKWRRVQRELLLLSGKTPTWNDLPVSTESDVLDFRGEVILVGVPGKEIDARIKIATRLNRTRLPRSQIICTCNTTPSVRGQVGNGYCW
jgi:hypothetical protein